MSHDFFALTAVVGFLAAVMVLAKACAEEGLFEAWGAVIARETTASPTRRFALVVAFLAVVAAVLTPHAAAVLLVPVLLVAARNARPATGIAAIRVANTGSTLLPAKGTVCTEAPGTASWRTAAACSASSRAFPHSTSRTRC